MDNNTLQHYGILGMKWGVRRTPAQLGTGKKKSVIQEEVKPKKKKLKDLSDTELQERVKRLELEKRYKDLSKSVNSTRGKDFALRVLEKIGENTLTNLGTQAANKGLGELINKAFDVDSTDTVKRIVNPNKGQSDKK